MTSTFTVFNQSKKVGVVLQGPPSSSKQLEDLYLKYTSMGYPTVVSSYSEYVNTDVIKHFVNNDQYLGKLNIKNSKCNVNYQILTTIRGIEYLESNFEVKYSLKLRSDMEIKNIEYHIESWISKVNSSSTPDYSPMKHKIIAFGRCRIRERNPWYIADYFSFGLLEDQKRYWSIPSLPLDELRIIRSEEYLSSAFLNNRPKGSHSDHFILVPKIAKDVFSYKWNADLSISIANEE